MKRQIALLLFMLGLTTLSYGQTNTLRKYRKLQNDVEYKESKKEAIDVAIAFAKEDLKQAKAFKKEQRKKDKKEQKLVAIRQKIKL